jgi:hypothetical protein
MTLAPLWSELKMNDIKNCTVLDRTETRDIKIELVKYQKFALVWES